MTYKVGDPESPPLDDWLAVGIRRRKEAERLSPYLIVSLRFASPEVCKRRGERTGHDRQRRCEGGCDTILVKSATPVFLCNECHTFALEAERRIRSALGLPPIEPEEGA